MKRMITRRGAPALLLAVLAMSTIAETGEAARPEKPRIPIHAWFGVPADQTSPERYRELALCGFTQNFTGFPNAEAVQKALDAARDAGIRQVISLPELEKDPERTVRRFKDHPALAGYHLQDEPTAGDFPRLAQWVKRIQAVDPEHGCYINLFPNYASPAQLGTATYQQYVDRFLAEVPVPYLSFDHYPVTSGGLRPGWYENLEIVSRAARKADKPFWAFALAVAHDPYPVAETSHLRLQAFSDLAYGAACVQYFTYWTPKSTVWNFHQAPVEDGKRTPVYDRVQGVNREIQGLAPVFYGARVVRVGHTGRLPAGTEAYRPEPPVREVRTEGEGAVVSRLDNGKYRYLVLVNRDYRAPLSLTVTFDGSTSIRRVDKEGGAPSVKSAYTGPVEPGDVVVYRWEGKPGRDPRGEGR
jgi:hypothetical protein